MIIKSIYLNNFRQYKGENIIEFSTNPEKNVTVILGANTSGKTTIVQAFNWCLYDIANFKRKKDLLNYELQERMGINTSQEVIVEIILFHENKEYTIRRNKRFTKNERGTIQSNETTVKMQYKEDNGEQQPIPSYEVKDTINKILPVALSEYFFFDGERIESINTRGDVVTAVRGLMGLDVVNAAVDRFNPDSAKSVTSKFYKELDVGSDKKAIKLKSDLSKYKEQLEQFSNRYEEVCEEIEFFEKRKKELDQKIALNSVAEKLQIEQKDLLRDIEVLGRNLDAASKRIKAQFSNGSICFFAYPIVEKALKVLEEAKDNVEGIPDMRAKAIEHILKRGYCICGLDLEKNEGAREKIEYEKSLLPPQHIGTEIRTHKKEYNRYIREGIGFCSGIVEDYKTYRENSIQLEIKGKQLSEISSKIDNTIDVPKIRDQYQQNNGELQKRTELKERIFGNISVCKDNIQKTEKEIDSLVIISEKNQTLKKCIGYCEELYCWFKTSYDKQEAEVKDHLLKSVNKIFTDMYHGTREVTITDNYKIELLTTVGDSLISTDESKGLEVVKNFSFIAGLVDLARQKAVSNSNKSEGAIDQELQAQTEPYPFVMDAPVSNADEKHIENIARILPEVAEQTIFIVMNKDWSFAKKALEGRVGSMFEISKVDNSDVWSKIRRIENV